MGRRQKIAIILATVLVLGGLFQNCGAGSSANGAPNSSTDDSEATLPKRAIDPAPLFKAGDAFDETKLPYSPGTGLVNKIKAKYKLYTGFKAVAMAQNGYGVIVVDSEITSQDEASVLAQERCQLFSGNRLCAVVAEGNHFKFAETELYQSHEDVLQYGPRNFDPLNIPGLAFVWRQKEASQSTGYLSRTSKFKAYAIGADGAASLGESDANQAEAIRRAYQFCENIVDQACTLYAVGNEIVFNVTAFVMGSEKYNNYGPRAFAASQVPYIRDLDRSGAMTALVQRVNSGEHAVVALSRFGDYKIIFASSMSANLEATALSACNALVVGATYDCFIYSKDLSVVFTRQTLLGANH